MGDREVGVDASTGAPPPPTAPASGSPAPPHASACTSSAPRATRSSSAPAPCSPTTRASPRAATPASCCRTSRSRSWSASAAIPADAALRRHPAGLIETGSRDLAAILADLERARHPPRLRRGRARRSPAPSSPAGLADEYAIYLAPALLGGDRLAIGDLGIPTIGDARRLRITSVEQLGDDLLVHRTTRPKEN